MLKNLFAIVGFCYVAKTAYDYFNDEFEVVRKNK